MIIRIKLDHEDCVSVERSWYEYNAGLDVLRYLMQQDSVNENYLQQYINISEKRYVELEMKKAAVDRKYRPNEIEFSVARYEFDFENEELVYEVDN